jgi:hypothetical protein
LVLRDREKVKRLEDTTTFSDDQTVALTVYAGIRGFLFFRSDPGTGERLLSPAQMP